MSEIVEVDAAPNEERVDWFMADVFVISTKVGEKEIEAMVSQAIQYLKAGRPLEWEKWSLLSPSSRLAFSEAAARLKVAEVFGK